MLLVSSLGKIKNLLSVNLLMWLEIELFRPNKILTFHAIQIQLNLNSKWFNTVFVIIFFLLNSEEN